MTQKKWYLTTPIFYPNANLHVGHAYTTTLSDILVRFHRALGEKTYLLSGSDENTEKMVEAARRAGKEPMGFLDEIVRNFHYLYERLDISLDQFIRTTDKEAHWKGAQALWKRLVAAGDIYKREYEGLYCVGHEAFITEKDLVDGMCPDHGTEPQFLKEENYFFRLSKYNTEIKSRIESNEINIVPVSRKHEILSLVNEGLEDVSFSRPRKPDWPAGLGIPVPGDDSQVMYVWCDALSNYITALGYGRGDDTLFKEFWPGMHVIGKDILRFHAGIWPGMLLSAGLPLPHTLLVHGFITSEGKKMSKTLGNVIDPNGLLDEYGTDAVRYILARHVSPFEDGDLTPHGIRNAYNANLANGLGNQVARVMKLASEHLEGPVALEKENFTLQEPFKERMEAFAVHEAVALIWEDIARADAYIQETKPFMLIKSENPSERAEGKAVIKRLVSHLATIATHLAPIMPKTAEEIQKAVRENRMPATLFPRKT